MRVVSSKPHGADLSATYWIRGVLSFRPSVSFTSYEIISARLVPRWRGGERKDTTSPIQKEMRCSDRLPEVQRDEHRLTDWQCRCRKCPHCSNYADLPQHSTEWTRSPRARITGLPSRRERLIATSRTLRALPGRCHLPKPTIRVSSRRAHCAMCTTTMTLLTSQSREPESVRSSSRSRGGQDRFAHRPAT